MKMFLDQVETYNTWCNRSGHDGFCYDNKYWMFGGYDSIKLLNDVHILDLQTFIWTKLESPTVPESDDYPPCLVSHNFSLYNCQYAILYGGTGLEIVSNSNKLYTFNLKTYQWKKINVIGDTLPTFYGASLTICNDSVFIFGGTTGFSFSNSIYKFTFTSDEEGKCELMYTIGAKPSPRYKHKAVLLKNRYIFIIGGGKITTSFSKMEYIHYYDIQSNKWSILKTKNPPYYCLGHVCNYLYNYDNPIIIIHGGRNHLKLKINKIYKLCLSSLKWKEIEIHDNKFIPYRDFHSSFSIVRNTIEEFFFVGGSSKNKRCNDLHKLCFKQSPSSLQCLTAYFIKQLILERTVYDESYKHYIRRVLKSYPELIVNGIVNSTKFSTIFKMNEIN